MSEQSTDVDEIKKSLGELKEMALMIKERSEAISNPRQSSKDGKDEVKPEPSTFAELLKDRLGDLHFILNGACSALTRFIGP